MSKILNPFRLIFYITNIITILIFILLIFSDKGMKQNDKLEKMVAKSSVRYNKTLKEYNELKQKIVFFKKNQFYQVKVIHREIGYIGENERIYIFSDIK